MPSKKADKILSPKAKKEILNQEKKAITDVAKDSEISSKKDEVFSSLAKSGETKGLGNTPKLILGIVITVVVVFILLIITFGVGIYKFNWQNQFIDKVVDIIPYPAVLLSFQNVPYNDYQDDLATLDYFYQAQEEANSGLLTAPSDDYLKKSVLSRMVREKFISQATQELGLAVSQGEGDKEFNNLVSQAGNEEEITKTLKTLYNWDAAQFKEKVLKPYLLRIKLQEYLAESDEINAEAKQKAESVLSLLNKGEKSFEDLAKEYSEDTTAASGGDLGFFGKGDMVKEFEEAVFALEPGATSDIIKTRYGYHIIKLIEKVPASENSSEQLHAAHILIKSKDIDEWINEQLAKKKVIIFISEFEWKPKCGLVLAPSETCEQNDLFDFTGISQGGSNSVNTAE